MEHKSCPVCGRAGRRCWACRHVGIGGAIGTVLFGAALGADVAEESGKLTCEPLDCGAPVDVAEGATRVLGGPGSTGEPVFVVTEEAVASSTTVVPLAATGVSHSAGTAGPLST